MAELARRMDVALINAIAEHMKMSRQQGFTLIELMIVVAIVAILAAIAVPAYNSQIQKSRRAEAVAEIGRLQLEMERWRADHSSYKGSGAGYPTAATMSYYTVTIPQDSASATGYTLSAAPKGAQTSDTTCSTLSLSVANGVISKSPATAGCWSK